jgi:drug/metabolite transporter (DMT)-like permease
MLGLLAFSAIRDRLSWVKPSVVHWKWVVFPALFTGLSWFAYTIALQHTYVANAAFLAYTAPVFTVLFAPLIIKEKLELKSFVALFMALLGTLTIMGFNSLLHMGASLSGDFYALTAGIIGGLIISFVKKIPKAMPSYQVNIVMSGLISLLLMPLVFYPGFQSAGRACSLWGPWG